MRLICFCLTIFCLGLVQAQKLDPDAIMRKLIEARGEERQDYPSVKVVDREKSIAAYAARSNTIIIEAKAIEVCQKLGESGEAALAFLISHELTHFFQQNLWHKGTEEIAFFASKAALDQAKNLEIEADTYGAFLCYLAGYDYARVAPLAIRSLYQAYQLDETHLAKYPSPEERMAMTSSICDQVEQYRLFFETAQVLDHFGAYNWSQTINNYLLQYLDFKEIYNNTGVGELRLVLSEMSDPMQYPLILKRSLSLRSGLERSVDSLLASAERHLKIATNKDPSDHASFINLAAVYLLMANDRLFEELLKQLQSVSESQDHLDRLVILKGIKLAREGRKGEAIKVFQGVKSKTNVKPLQKICKYNIAVLHGKEQKIKIKPSNPSYHFPSIQMQGESIDVTLSAADPLFPKKATLMTTDDTTQLTLNNGMRKIVLWRVKSMNDHSLKHTNGYLYIRNGEKTQWYVQGLDDI